MNLVGWVYAVLFYASTLILVGGLVFKIVRYARTPAPLKIPTTPAPVTKTGVVMRMFREVVFFESLFKSNKSIWLFGWLFHAALALVLLRHVRYFQQPLADLIVLIQPFGHYAGFAMVAGLGGLWARRFFVDRVRYISAPSDHFILGLLIAIAVSGITMKYYFQTDIVALKQYLLGLMAFNFDNALPADPMLLIHLSLVILLMVMFPFSKLLHAPGVFFSPTRNQRDNPREQRHVAPWAVQLESNKA